MISLHLRRRLLLITMTCLALAWSGFATSVRGDDLKLLFLGDNGHHRPGDRAAQLIPVLAERGIHIQYTDDVGVLASDTLEKFDGLIIYANTTEISPQQEAALLDYVQGGHGFIPLHCASYCFLNSDSYVKLVGAQFQKHGTGIVDTDIAEPDHPVMRGFGGFTSWDETYVHTKHNAENRTVLEYRPGGEQADGNEREPWTWVRTQGRGRVFYTAWGHDQRTWSNPGFQNLVERGIRWACHQDVSVVADYRERAPFTPPTMTSIPEDLQPFEYIDVGAKIPNYTPGARWGTQGKPLTMMQQPLPPGEAIKHYVTPEGFSLQLYASDPDLGGKPISMTWDERGRLWVCETYDYPNELQPRGEGRDRIRICEDTDGDGKADKFTVFAEQLSIPTAITCYRGGVIVQNGTETLYLKDTDGDDKADVRKTLITGWALGDTHGGVSNFQYGLDNWIYAMQGYNNSTPTIDGEQQQSFRMGFFRFRMADAADEASVRVAEIEFLRSTDNNTWGLGLSEEGLVFGSTANHNPSVFMPIPNRYYERVRGWGPEQLSTIADTYLFKPITDKVRQVDQFGGYTAGAGHALYTARRYPEMWWNRTAFVCGPTGHLVGTFVLNSEGTEFHSTSPSNLIAADDEWAAPIMAEVGPDGNVWVLDWYNFIVQHNPTPQGFETGRGNAYESDLRDKKHGRIYRVVYEGDGADTAVQLSDSSSQQLVETLTNPTMLVRKQAQRLLVERGDTSVVSALMELAADQSTDAVGLNVGAIHALWTLHGLGALEGDDSPAIATAVAALKHPSAGVRRNAIQVLPPTSQSTAALLEAGVLTDADAQVRLAAVLALADQAAANEADADAAQAVSSLIRSQDVMNDRWMADALTSAAAARGFAVLSALTQQPVPDQSLELVTIVAEHLGRSRPNAGQTASLVEAIGAAEPKLAGAILSGLAEGWPSDHRVALPDGLQSELTALFERLPSGAKGQLIRLTSLWGSDALKAHADAITKSLLDVATDSDASSRDRIAAAQDLVAFRADDDGVVTELLDAVTPQTPPDVAQGFIGALAASTSKSLGEELIERSQGLTPTVREAAVRVLLAREESTFVLVDAIDDGDFPLADLSLDQRQAIANHPNRRIREMARELLERGGALPNADRQKVLDELMPLTQRTGDPEAGFEIFKKQCSKCHVHGTEGTRIGPDLTGMAVHPKAELLTNIIDPSRSVEGNFRVYMLVTTDGIVMNGMLASESRTSIELIDTEAKRHSLPREDVEELVASNKSLMPEGFEKLVTQEEITNLLEFLSRPGKYLPLDLRKVATSVSTRGMFYNEDADAERLIFRDWTPKTFNDVPFVLVDPQGDRVRNAVVLYGPIGQITRDMPRSVTLPCNAPAKAVHFLSGVSGWGYPYGGDQTVSMIVRLHYADGSTEDHELKNGVEFADYIRRVDVPGSEFAFRLRGQQIRYFAIEPKQEETITEVELVKGPDDTAPVVMAVTVETP